MNHHKIGSVKDQKIGTSDDNGEPEKIMVISPNQIYRETITAYLFDLGYSVIGPYDNVDSGSMSYRRTPPELIIFDANTPQSELISFSQFLQSDGQDIPVLVVKKEDELGIMHTNVAYIRPPINLYELDQKLKHLLKKDSASTGSESTIILEFTNKLFVTILESVPITLKADIHQVIQETLTQFSLINSDVERQSEEALTLRLVNSDQLDQKNFVNNLQVVLEEMVNRIDETQEAEWGKSLLEDSLEMIVLTLPNLPDAAMKIVESMGKDPEIINKRFKTVVPDHTTLNKSVLVAKMTLSDLGPILNTIVSRDDILAAEFDASIASQLITLIGQGSSYHQGIYGPVPLPKTKDVVAIMWSKLLKAEIKDVRMAGRTLVVVCIGFRREIINLMPNRSLLQEILSPLDTIDHANEITDDFLRIIEERFEGHLKNI